MDGGASLGNWHEAYEERLLHAGQVLTGQARQTLPPPPGCRERRDGGEVALALLAASTLMLGDLAQLAGVRGSFGTGLLSRSLGRGEGLMPLHSDEQMSPAVAVPAQVLIQDIWATLWQPLCQVRSKYRVYRRGSGTQPGPLSWRFSGLCVAGGVAPAQHPHSLLASAMLVDRVTVLTRPWARPWASHGGESAGDAGTYTARPWACCCLQLESAYFRWTVHFSPEKPGPGQAPWPADALLPQQPFPGATRCFGTCRKSKAKPNGKKPAAEEKKMYLEPEYAKSRITDVGFKELVVLPREIDLNEWLASNTTTFFHHVNLQYSTISEFCTGEACQTMAVCNTQYYWYDERGKKVKCTAPQYVDFVMSSVQKLVTDEDVFPTKYGREFPSSFESLVKKICKYLFHVLAHIYWSHFKETLALELHGHLNTLYVHFILFAREFNLLDPKDTAVMDDLTEVLCSGGGGSGGGPGGGSPLLHVVLCPRAPAAG
ncbi:MOB kinase activator 2, partial [Herpailurus yagouaroundi]|uniref:MOB kinase activator 2 n=1 Tax=Herpailurus yagouaroundi TaxID=1608482 RepID=UPI001AD67E24